MFKKYLLCLMLVLGSVCAHEEFIETNSVKLWCESFGERENPPVLLIMGAGCQGIMWPQDFCDKLVDKGFFVIRYDHRDMGQSSSFDFAIEPYDLMDLTKDSIGILDHFGIDKARIVGISMGGEIGQLLGAHYPERVKSLVLISTSPDFTALHDAFEGNETNSLLSSPTEEYLACLRSVVNNPAENDEERLLQDLRWWGVCNGFVTPFDTEMYKELLGKQMERALNPTGVNNLILAMKASLEEAKQASSKIDLPTTVVHGTEDPIFPLDHGKSLSERIPGSKLVILDGMGHILNTHFLEDILAEIN